MKSFIKLQTVLNRIPKTLFNESSEADFLDWMLDGLKLLPQTIHYEPKIELFEIIDGKVQLPNYVKQINSVSWQETDPSRECIEELITSIQIPVATVAPEILTFNGSVINDFTGNNQIPYAGTGGECIITQFDCTVSGITTKLKSVKLNMTSDVTGELDIRLKAPNGQVICLVWYKSGTNFTNTIFADDGGIMPISGSHTGTFAPQGIKSSSCVDLPASDVAAFSNFPSGMNGVWSLLIDDGATGDVSNLIDWSLTFEASASTVVPTVISEAVVNVRNENVIPITYKMWLDSPYYKNNYKVLKYAGTDKSLISNTCDCWKSNCHESFVVTPQKTMYLTLNDGFICVTYEAPVCDEDGNILIPDTALLHEFLATYAIYKHWEERQFSKEEQAGSFYQEYKNKQALLLRQTKGDHHLRNFNIANTVDIIGGQYKKLIKIPEILFYAR
jgi:subtilisin-like proprotein convertase family protein